MLQIVKTYGYEALFNDAAVNIDKSMDQNGVPGIFRAG